MSEFLTARLPGTGGSIRQQPEDFQVDEIPLYEPCGEGDHLYLRIEKRGLTTYDLLRELAKALQCNERDLGYAGLKDPRGDHPFGSSAQEQATARSPGGQPLPDPHSPAGDKRVAAR
jgi:hypothetical protein